MKLGAAALVALSLLTSCADSASIARRADLGSTPTQQDASGEANDPAAVASTTTPSAASEPSDVLDSTEAAPSPEALPDGLVTASQLNDFLPALLGPTDDLPGTMQRLIDFPDMPGVDGADINKIVVYFTAIGESDGPSQRKAIVVYQTDRALAEVYDFHVDSLSSLGAVLDQGPDEITVRPDRSDTSYLQATVWSSDGITNVRLAAFLDADVGRDIERFGQWHGGVLPELPSTPVTEVRIDIARSDAGVTDTEYSVAWAGFSDKAGMDATLTDALDQAGWEYELAVPGLWRVQHPTPGSSFSTSLSWYVYFINFEWENE